MCLVQSTWIERTALELRTRDLEPDSLSFESIYQLFYCYCYFVCLFILGKLLNISMAQIPIRPLRIRVTAKSTHR
jgi:hypothetical protein